MEQIERNFLLVMLGLPIIEYVLNSFYSVGFIVYAVFVGVVLILMENEIGPTKEEKTLVFLMIIPICRLAELFLNLNFFWSTLLFYLMIIALVVYYALKFKIKTKPFIGNPGIFLIVLGVSGVASLATRYLLNWNNYSLVFLIPIIAYAEEIFFRGGFQNLTKEWFGNFSILLTSFVYASFSLSYGFVFTLIAFFSSLIISTFYHFKRNLYITYLLNIGFHVVLVVLYPGIFS